MLFRYRWLGAAGLELHLDGVVLLIDPFLTRPPAWKVFSLKGVMPDRASLKRNIPRADYILVTHSHYDHLLDVPEIIQMTGARVAGSENTCKIIGLHGVAQDQISLIKIGDRLTVGPFSVEVFPARHTRTPLDRWINGPLPPRVNQGRLPIRLVDYRMDACFSFRIQAGNLTIMVGNQPTPADILFISPFYSPSDLEEILGSISPRLVVPIHWDNFTQPLSAPLQPMLVTGLQGWGFWPPVRLIHLGEFAERIHKIHPGITIKQPTIFKLETYEPG